MNFGPGNRQALLAGRQQTRHGLDRLDAENSDSVLVIGVEVRPMMRSTRLDEHPDDDSKKAADFGHGYRQPRVTFTSSSSFHSKDSRFRPRAAFFWSA